VNDILADMRKLISTLDETSLMFEKNLHNNDH